MRTLGRLILVLMVLVPSFWLAQRIWQSLRWDELAAVLSGRIETASPSSAYKAMHDGWLSFELSPQANSLRVRSNALIGSDQIYPPETEWWYVFDYQLLDAQGGMIKEGVYHHRTRATRYLDPNTGLRVGRNFILDTHQSPTDGRGMLLDFEPGWRPTLLRIHPRQPIAPLQDLVFRVYESLPNPENQLGYLWQRLPESKKQRLSGNSVYGLDLLREREKQNLLRHEWMAVGPMGVEGEEYQVVKLYLSRDLDGEIIEPGQIPYGLYCDEVLHSMIPLPTGDWRLTLEMTELQTPERPMPETLMHWYGAGLGNRWQTSLPSSPGEIQIERRFDGGLLELVTPRPIVLRVWGEQQGERRELTPNPLRLRGYQIDASSALTVAIDHVAEQPTPFRLDIRSRLPQEGITLPDSIGYEWLDGSDNSLKQGRLPLNLFLSHYDRLSNLEPGVHLSDPERFYFQLPVEVAVIRFSASHPLLLTTYSRPPNMRRELRIGHETSTEETDLEQQPAWFLLRPNNEELLRRIFRSEVVMLQPRPPETDPRLLAGEYDWTLYQPRGDWRARQLLLPRRDDLPVRDRSLSAVFHQLRPDGSLPLRFRTLPGRRKSQPRLIYLRDRDTPLDVRINLDNHQILNTQIAGRQGELQLPALPPGDAQLDIESGESVRWLINQAEAETPTYLQRLAMELDPEGLSFDYDKETPGVEVLSGELFLADRESQRLKVKISTPTQTPDQPFREWTFRDRHYDIKVDESVPIIRLNTSLPPLAGGERFFLPLGSDLPVGNYRIHFNLEGNSEAYLTLYRLIAGNKTLHTFFQETSDEQ